MDTVRRVEIIMKWAYQGRGDLSVDLGAQLMSSHPPSPSRIRQGAVESASFAVLAVI